MKIMKPRSGIRYFNGRDGGLFPLEGLSIPNGPGDFCPRTACTSIDADQNDFKVLDIGKKRVEKQERRRKRIQKEVPPARFIGMKTDQDWTSVWPAASSFKWSAVPFPVRQGFINRMSENVSEHPGLKPGKYANAELMKIPNFLHLTPPHVKKHCAALKEFCSPWPAGLETDENCEKHFPIEVQIADYLSARPSLRDLRARVVTVKLKLSRLELDYHAKDKFIRLVGEKYNKETDEVTLTVDRCPTKKQNYEYAMYLLAAVYHESWNVEPWEKEKAQTDWERFYWDLSKSKQTLISILDKMKQIEKPGYLPDDFKEEQIESIPEIQQYKDAVTVMLDKGENCDNMTHYKNSVKDLFNFKSDISCVG